MNTIFSIIAFPITAGIEIICFIFAMFFEPSFQTQNGVSVFKRIYRESHNLLLNRMWDDWSPWFQATVAMIIYFSIFF